MKETIVKKLNKTNAPRLTAARKASLANVRNTAFQSGVSRNAVIAAVTAACGRRPVLTLYNAAKLELQIGLMASALARKGDNREPSTLMEHCRERLTFYAGFGGKGKLKAGQRGRRTKVEEDAYASARVTVSGIMRDAGVTVPESRGGDRSKTRAPGRQAAKAAPKAANDSKPIVRRFAGKPALIDHFNVQAAALLANVNRNAAICPIELKSAVSDFVARVKALKA